MRCLQLFPNVHSDQNRFEPLQSSPWPRILQALKQPINLYLPPKFMISSLCFVLSWILFSCFQHSFILLCTLGFAIINLDLFSNKGFYFSRLFGYYCSISDDLFVLQNWDLCQLTVLFCVNHLSILTFVVDLGYLFREFEV